MRARFFAAHAEDEGTNAIPLFEIFPRDQLIAADDGLSAAKINHHIAIFHALDGTADDFADFVLELIILFLTLSITDLLQNHLLGRLRSDATEIDGGEWIFNFIAQLQLCIDFFGFFQCQLRLLLFFLDFLNYRADAVELDGTGFTINLGADILLVTVFAAAGHLNRLLHCIDNRLLWNAFLATHGIGNL